MKNVNLEIEGMTCEGCAITIANYLKREEGVKEVDVNYEDKTGIVTFDSKKIDEETILKNRVLAGHYLARISTRK